MAEVTFFGGEVKQNFIGESYDDGLFDQEDEEKGAEN